MKKVTLIIDLQFGSTGKGLIAGYLAERNAPDTVINANMPNAGHTYINDEGRVWIHKVLPNGIVSPGLKRVMIGPQSVFSADQLRNEIEGSADLLAKAKLLIHPDAVVLMPTHREKEQNTLSGISSTMQGSAAAAIEKMMRQKSMDCRAVTALKGTDLEQYVINHEEWKSALRLAEDILAEGAQGYSLGINAGFWPFCTSRDCTPARFMADMGLPLKWLDKVVGTARVHPIRVGNTPDGYSGDCYPDQKEIDWKDIGIEPELTTVTKRPRRIFTWSEMQISDACFYCEPDEIFLNFCNYDEEMAAEIVRVSLSKGRPIKYLGYGPARGNIGELQIEVK